MDDEPTRKPDLMLENIAKQDLSDMSVADLEIRISAMRTEITRCEAAITARQSTIATAETFFKS